MNEWIINAWLYFCKDLMGQVLKNEPSKICERQSLKIWRGMVCLKQGLLLKPGPGPWTRIPRTPTLKNLEPEKPGP